MNVERILVAIDASPGSLSAAEAAASLAALLGAELEGLFVEDERLLRLAESPLAREVDHLTAGLARTESGAMLRGLRLQGIRARQALARIAERHGIRWSFRTVRGPVSREIAAAATAAQIVSLGPGGWSTRPQYLLGAAASAVLEKRRACTLLLRRRFRVGPPVLVVYDGTDEAQRALDLGRRLVGDDSKRLRILLVGTEQDPHIRRLEPVFSRSVTGRVASAADPGLKRLLSRAHAGVLVVPVSGADGNRDMLHELLAEVECPVLLVS